MSNRESKRSRRTIRPYSDKRPRMVRSRISRQSVLSALRVFGWGLPDKFKVRLRFTDYVGFTQAGGSYAEKFYRPIGPYDPRVAAGGDYPAYYSQLMALYQYQRTVKSTIKVEFLANTTAAGAGGFAEGVIYPSTTATGVTGLNDAIDKRGSKHCSISYYLNPPQCNLLVARMNPASYLGMTKKQYMDSENTRSLVGALPSQIMYWAIGTQVNDVSTTIDVSARITIIYTIEFHGLVPLDTVDSAND